MVITLYSTSQCDKCKKLATFLSSKGIEVNVLVTDKNTKARSAAAMDKVLSVPVLKKENGKLMRMKNIFVDPTGSVINETAVLNFVTEE